MSWFENIFIDKNIKSYFIDKNIKSYWLFAAG
jgi:hypothetical protein